MQTGLENIFLDKKDTSRKDELTLRYKLDWDMDNTTKIKFLVSQVDKYPQIFGLLMEV